MLPQALVMAVLMPIAGRFYDKIGMRWLAVPGLALTANGTWLLTGIGPDMTYGDVVTWTCVRAAGMGLAMMPIMAGGIAVLPMSAVNQGSAWNKRLPPSRRSSGPGRPRRDIDHPTVA